MRMFDVIKLPKELDDLPESNVPYYVVAKEGLYLYKQTAIGPCLLPQKTDVSSMNSMGEYKGGYFLHKAPDVPAHIMSQALDFFRQVYDLRKAEAEVFILLNQETEEFRLFIPWQVTSHGGVDSIYDEADIPENFTIIGTIHSHCDFSAFHSSTDMGDASDFNGLHITIGHVNTNAPSFDQMVMINKLKFTYKSVSSVADVSKLGETPAPKEWLGFVFDRVEECVDRYFPTLTKEQIDEFIKQCRPSLRIASTNSKGKTDNQVNSNSIYSMYDDWDDDWRQWLSEEKKQGNGYLSSTRWSDEFRRSVPAEWFAESGYGAKLTKEGFEAAMTEELEKLWLLAAEHNFFLDYKMNAWTNSSGMDDSWKPVEGGKGTN